MSDTLKQLSKLSAAEEFLDYLGVDYDQQVLNVNRLHILKRFQQYMAATPYLGKLDEAKLRETCRGLLSKAYSDFLRTTPKQEKLFKVFKQNEHAVSLENLQASLATRRSGG